MIPPTVDAWPAPPPVRGRPPAREALVVSPELALVDDDLRSEALARLPDLQPFAFLERLAHLPFETEPARRVFVEAPVPERASPGLGVAVAAYLASAIVRTLAFNLLVFASVALVVLVVNLAA